MIAGFDELDVAIGSTAVHGRRGGSGPPVLLLHGFPETHLMWHRVGPALAERFAVVAPDLPGYGASRTQTTPDHRSGSKRAMAATLVQLMRRLGHERFAVIGHDRGGRVAYRMALDHPDRVDRLAVLDVVPIVDALERADARLALGYWPWSLLAQPEPLPERLLAAAPGAIVDAALDGWGTAPECFPPDVRAAYVAALRDPAIAHAVCEDYRAAATFDQEDDRHDRAAGRRTTCPSLVLWAADGPLDSWYADTGGPLGIWRRWTVTLTGHAVGGGHFFAEQNPEATVADLHAFLADDPPTTRAGGSTAADHGATRRPVQVRELAADDWPRVWPIVEEVIRPGETFPYDPAMTAAQARNIWVVKPPGRTTVAVDSDRVVGTAHMQANRPGPGSHVSTATSWWRQTPPGAGSAPCCAATRSTGPAAAASPPCSSTRSPRPTKPRCASTPGWASPSSAPSPPRSPTQRSGTSGCTCSTKHCEHVRRARQLQADKRSRAVPCVVVRPRNRGFGPFRR